MCQRWIKRTALPLPRQPLSIVNEGGPAGRSCVKLGPNSFPHLAEHIRDGEAPLLATMCAMRFGPSNSSPTGEEAEAAPRTNHAPRQQFRLRARRPGGLHGAAARSHSRRRDFRDPPAKRRARLGRASRRLGPALLRERSALVRVLRERQAVCSRADRAPKQTPEARSVRVSRRRPGLPKRKP